MGADGETYLFYNSDNPIQICSNAVLFIPCHGLIDGRLFAARGECSPEVLRGEVEPVRKAPGFCVGDPNQGPPSGYEDL